MTATVEFPVEPQVKEFTARRWQLLIDGEWVKVKSEQTFQTHNPATNAAAPLRAFIERFT